METGMTDNTKDSTPKKENEPERRNAQSEHHGSSHRPEEFDSQNPQKQVPDKQGKKR
jgi:hypothetical protein